MKLHLANGTVYLKDYINVDLDIEGHHLANKHPEIVKENITTVDNYYKLDVKKEDYISGKFYKRKVACDRFMDITKPIKGKYSEILIVQAFEHFTIPECEQMLDNWNKVLTKGGLLHIDVPDFDGNVAVYHEAKTLDDKKWGIRLIAGSHKNEYAVHKSQFTKEVLKDMLERHGFTNVKVNNRIEHNYPAFGMDAFKN